MPIHVRAKPEDIAPIVFLPGDPTRAQMIAENFMQDPVCYTDYRHMYGYTGSYKGLRFSVQTTGMGGPSAAIVCEELAQLGAKFFIRIGSCGSLQPNIELSDLILASTACPMDGTSNEIFGRTGFAPNSNFVFLRRCIEYAENHDFRAHVGPVASVDCFYGPSEDFFEQLKRYGILAIEMEASTVLTIAAKYGLRGAALFCVSDIVHEKKRASDEKIWEGVRRMIEMGLQAAQ
ncbi:MAG: hypothetical protein WC966_07870 [Bradymonadales bacterium]